MASFFDTNVLIYTVDHFNHAKQKKARQLLEHEAAAGNAIISTQVLQEFYFVSTSKLKQKVDKSIAEQMVSELCTLTVKQVDIPIIMSAIQRNNMDQVSIWDALIIEAALDAGATVLWSEDMQHGRKINGMEIRNPFN